jgi:hypothetical protein
MKIFVNSWDCQRLQSSGIATPSTAERPKTEALNIVNATENYRAGQLQSLHYRNCMSQAPPPRPLHVITVCPKKCNKTAKSVI